MPSTNANWYAHLYPFLELDVRRTGEKREGEKRGKMVLNCFFRWDETRYPSIICERDIVWSQEGKKFHKHTHATVKKKEKKSIQNDNSCGKLGACPNSSECVPTYDCCVCVCARLYVCVDPSLCFHQGFIMWLIPVLSEGSETCGKDKRCEEAMQPAEPTLKHRPSSAAKSIDQSNVSVLRVGSESRRLYTISNSRRSLWGCLVLSTPCMLKQLIGTYWKFCRNYQTYQLWRLSHISSGLLKLQFKVVNLIAIDWRR